MRDVVNNQDVDKYTKMIRKYCSVREMRIRERGRTRQKAINPLHDPGKDNVKQRKTNEDKDKKEGRRQLRKKGGGTSELVWQSRPPQ
jgi:hypothetical protein